MDEIRISKGIARWTANFTPPTREYPLYYSKGNYTSQVFDAGSSSTWDTLNWTNTSSTGNNITFQVMSCDDASCSGETWVGPDNTSSTYFLTQPITLNTSITPNTQYFRYAAFFETNASLSATSYLQDVNLSYSGLTTNATGEYTYTWTAPSTVGSYPIKVNSTYGNYYGENTQTLTVQQVPVINSISIYPEYPKFGENVTFIVNVTDDNLKSVNFSIFYPNGTLAVNEANQTSGITWNYTYNLSIMGTWTWNATAYDNSGLSSNSSTQSIILLNLSETLSPSTVNTSGSVTVSGHISLTNGTNVSNTVVYIYQNGTLLSSTCGNFSTTDDTSSNNWSAGTFVDTKTDTQNVTLNNSLDNFTKLLLHRIKLSL